MSSGFDPVPSDRLEVTSEVGAALTDFDYRLMASLLKITHSLRWPKDTIGYLAERITMEGLQIPVSQLSGFTQFTAQAAPTIDTEESTTSPSFTDLATVGPKLTGLPDGQYVILWGCYAYITVAGQAARMGVEVNTTDPGAGMSCFTTLTTNIFFSRAATTTLSNAGNNSLTARYSAALGTATFGQRWLIALKFADL